MSVLSRFCLNMAANVGLQYAAELLPTPIRSQGVSLIHIFGIVAHSLAPYIVDSVSDFLWQSRLFFSREEDYMKLEYIFFLLIIVYHI